MYSCIHKNSILDILADTRDTLLQRKRKPVKCLSVASGRPSEAWRAQAQPLYALKHLQMWPKSISVALGSLKSAPLRISISTDFSIHGGLKMYSQQIVRVNLYWQTKQYHQQGSISTPERNMNANAPRLLALAYYAWHSPSLYKSVRKSVHQKSIYKIIYKNQLDFFSQLPAIKLTL